MIFSKKKLKKYLKEKSPSLLKVLLAVYRRYFILTQYRHHLNHLNIRKDPRKKLKKVPQKKIYTLDHTYGGICNLGDYINVFLFEQMGYEVALVKHYSKKKVDFLVLGVGTCLDKMHLEDMIYNKKVRKNILVWGSGVRDKNEINFLKNLQESKKLKIFALRGLVSKNLLAPKKNIPLGDPAFLLPMFLKLKRKNDGKVTYIPHYQNQKNLKEKMKILGAEDYFDIRIPKKKFIGATKRIVNSGFVLTNSLHGAIICQAYGVPYAPCILPGEKIDSYLKWEDAFSWLGIWEDFRFVKNYREGRIWWENVGSKVKINKKSMIRLMKSFPLDKSNLKPIL